MSLGPTELIIILVIVLVVFGGGRIGDLGGAVGKTIREFKSSVKDEEPTVVPPAPPAPPTVATPAAPSAPTAASVPPSAQTPTPTPEASAAGHSTAGSTGATAP